MKRTVVLSAFFILVASLTGCSTNPVDETMSKILTQVQEANNKLGAIRAELDKAAKKAEGKKITLEDLKETFKKGEELRKVGQELMALKTAADLEKSKVDAEKRQAVQEKYGQRLADSIKRLSRQQEQLQESLSRVRAQVDNKKTAEKLDEAMLFSIQEFEALTRQR